MKVIQYYHRCTFVYPCLSSTFVKKALPENVYAHVLVTLPVLHL